MIAQLLLLATRYGGDGGIGGTFPLIGGVGGVGAHEPYGGGVPRGSDD
jgi:hypothetical protein